MKLILLRKTKINCTHNQDLNQNALLGLNITREELSVSFQRGYPCVKMWGGMSKFHCSSKYSKIMQVVPKIKGSGEGHSIYPLMIWLYKLKSHRMSYSKYPSNFVPVQPSEEISSPNASLHSTLGANGGASPPDSLTPEVGWRQKGGLLIRTLSPSQMHHGWRTIFDYEINWNGQYLQPRLQHSHGIAGCIYRFLNHVSVLRLRNTVLSSQNRLQGFCCQP